MGRKLLLEHINVPGIESYDVYRKNGGYRAVEKALKSMSPQNVVEEVQASGLRGRGGAAFPTGIKWKTVAAAQAPQKYIVCNADEGDPGFMGEQGKGIARIDRAQDLRRLDDGDQAQDRDGGEPQQHDRPEPCADLGGTTRLERKKRANNQDGYGQDPGTKALVDIFETFRRGQDRHRRRNHGVAIEKGGCKNAKHHERCSPFCARSLPVDQREKR